MGEPRRLVARRACRGNGGQRGNRRRNRRRLLAVAGLVALVALLGITLGVDVATRRHVHRLQQQIAAVTARAAQVRVAQAATDAGIQDDSAAAASLTRRISATSGSIDLTHLAIAKVNRAVFFQGIDLGSLTTCVGGIRRAYDGIAAGRRDAAVTSLTAAAASCQSVHGGGSTGLTYPFDFPDPFVLRAGKSYFAYATNAAAGKIQIIRSSDLSHWVTVGDALPHVAAWATPGAVWGPSVLRVGSTYVLYYSALKAGTEGQCISTAVAPSPAGPFVDDSTKPLVCQLAANGSIDPSPYVDTNGTPYLYWRSLGGHGSPATIWAQQLAPDGRSFASPKATPILQPSQRWEDGIIEGPSMASLDGHLILLYSGNKWMTARYAVGAAACAGPLGPCRKVPDNPILTSEKGFAGPGGEAVFTDASGTTWLAFHAWLPDEVGYPHSRMLYLRRLSLVHGTLVVSAPR